MPAPTPEEWPTLLSRFELICKTYLQQLPHKNVATEKPFYPTTALPIEGAGLNILMDTLNNDVLPQSSASRGPRYWGFVTGGATPVATFADWLVSLLDQNVSKDGDSIASTMERQTIQWLTALFDLPSYFTGLFTSGATASNFLAAVTARQFSGLQQGINVAKDGMANLDVAIFSACPHASMTKTLGLAGFGQHNLIKVNCLAGSEQMNPEHLKQLLQQTPAPGKIVISSAATVTGTSFDDLQAITKLCKQHNAWLHVDAAFGIFERLLNPHQSQSQGLEHADSITLDGHKWLNVPYDSGVFLTRHQNLLHDACHVAAPYLQTDNDIPDFMSLGIENSRRFRALPAWASILAYGKAGIRHWVSQNCCQAKQLATYLEHSDSWKLVHPCGLNVVLFRPQPSGQGYDDALTKATLRTINRRGKVFFSPGMWQGEGIIRAAFSNWSTTTEDVALAITELEACISW